MGDCKNAISNEDTFTIVGRGGNEAEAKADLEAKRDKKLLELAEKLKCSDDKCKKHIGSPGEEDEMQKEKVIACQLDWAPVGEPKPESYQLKMYRSKQLIDRVAMTQTFEVGCFCF